MDTPIFLEVADVIEIHRDQIERYGGSPGIRDFHLLHSAVAMPMASYGGEWLHRDIFEMAAAYVFHIVLDHPFVDGNKRAGLASGLVFLDFNGIEIDELQEELYRAAIDLASGNLDKLSLAAMLKSLS